jgi:hypothetical protein
LERETDQSFQSFSTSKTSIPDHTERAEVLEFLEAVEKLQRSGDLQKLSELLAGAELFEVDLAEVNRLYFKDREIGKLVGRVVSLFVVKEDYVRAKAVVKLTPVQKEFVERFVRLKRF